MHLPTFLETGRVEVLYDPDHPLAADRAEFVIARLVLDFRSEILWPGSVTVGTGVARTGTSSLTLAQSVFQNGQAVAHAETVIVHVDTASRKARPLTDEAHGLLEALLLDDA